MKKLVMPSLDKTNEVLRKIIKILDKYNLPYVFEASNELTIDFNPIIGTLRLTEVETDKADDTKQKKRRGRPPKESNGVLPNNDKNLIMIRRIVKSKDTKDPAVITNTIMGSLEIRKQTTFKSAKDVLTWLDKYKGQL